MNKIYIKSCLLLLPSTNISAPYWSPNLLHERMHAHTYIPALESLFTIFPLLKYPLLSSPLIYILPTLQTFA